MSRYEQLSMFTMNVEQVTAACCMDARHGPVRWSRGWRRSSQPENMW